MAVETELPTRFAAKAILVHRQTGRVLILRLNEEERLARGIDEWHVPGGSQDDASEPLPDVAVRETLEETGITGKVVGELGKAAWNALYKGVPTHFESKFYHLVVQEDGATPPEPQLSREHSEAAWVLPTELGQYPDLTPEAVQYIGVVSNE